MPLFYFHCNKCDKTFFKLLDPEKGKSPYPCPDCQELANRKPKAPSTMCYETVDNGLMGKKVVRPADAERIFKERAIEHSRQHREEIDEGDLDPLDK